MIWFCGPMDVLSCRKKLQTNEVVARNYTNFETKYLDII